jgi:hypothetical protein
MQISFTCSLQLCLNLRYLGIHDLSVKVNTKMGTNDWRSGPSVRYQTLKFNYHRAFSFKKSIFYICMLIHSVLWFAYRLLSFLLLCVRQDEIALSPPWRTEAELSGGEWLNSRSCRVSTHEITHFTRWIGDEDPQTGLDHLDRRNVSCSFWNWTPGRPPAA